MASIIHDMDPTRISTQVRVKQCSLCQGDTEYYCHHCQQHMCLQCKNIHVIDIDTKDHEVTRYAEKTKLPTIQVTSARSQDSDNREPCEAPVSDLCPEHRPWRFLPPVWLSHLEHSRRDEIERRLYSKRIYYLRGETLYYRHVLVKGFRHDVKTGHKKVTIRGQSKAEERAQELKDLIDNVLAGDLQDRCLIQKTRLSKHIARLRMYELRYVQYLSRPVKYLRFMKHKHDPQKDEQKLIKALVKIMKGMQLSTEKGKRQAGNELLLTLLPSPVLKKSFTVNDVANCQHISIVTPDRVWVSNRDKKFILADTTTGDKLYSVDASLFVFFGLHTVNSNCELIYIDKNTIKKVSNDLKTTTIFIESKSPWKLLSVYCSPFTGDLLVGMYKLKRTTNMHICTGQVLRYNITGKHTQTIPNDNTGELTQTIPNDNKPHTLYEFPIYITENNNGDVVVSDTFFFGPNALVVTDRGGRYRFSYTGHPSGSGVVPYGICTDVLSHILICDQKTATVQMINKDGEFLSYLLTAKSPGIYGTPWSLSYDVNTHLLWVGSVDNNTVFLYRYLNRHLTITDDREVCEDVSVSHSSPCPSIPKYSQEEFDMLRAKKEARKIAEAVGEKADKAVEAVTKASKAVRKAMVRTERKIIAEESANTASRAAWKAVREAAEADAAADAAANAATTAEADAAVDAVKAAAKAAAKAAKEAIARAQIATETILNDVMYYYYYDDNLNDDLDYLMYQQM